MAEENFHRKLNVAQKYERWIGLNYDVVKYNDDNRYDLLLSNGIKIEVKHDHGTRTGNMCIEFMSRNKPSCISVTESDYHIFVFPMIQEIWMMKTDKLKEMIKDFKIGLTDDNWTTDLMYFDNLPGGDADPITGEKTSKIHLFRMKDIKHLFKTKSMYIPIYKRKEIV